MAKLISLSGQQLTTREAVDEMYYAGVGLVVTSDDGERNLLISTTSEFRTPQFGLVTIQYDGKPLAAFSSEQDTLAFAMEMVDAKPKRLETGSMESVIADELHRLAERDAED